MTGTGRRSATGFDGSTAGSASTPASSSATRACGGRRWATTRSAASATPEQIDEMAALLGAALADGALGFSTSQSPTHNDGRRRAGAVAQRVARRAARAGRGGARASGHHARGDPPRLHQRLHRRRDRAADRHVGGRRPAAQLERARRLVGEPRPATSRSCARPTTPPSAAAASSRSRCRTPCGSGCRSCPASCSTGSPAGARCCPCRCPSGCAALADPDVRRRLDAGAHSEEAGMLRGLANWERLDHRRDVRPRERRRDGRTIGEIADGRAATRAVRRAARHRGRRRAAHRALAAAVRRRRSRLAAARRGVARPGRGDRRLRRRRPPRHDVRRDLHDVAARPRRARAPGGDARGGGPADHRRAGPALRAAGARPDHARLARRPRDVRPGDRRPRARAHPLRPARWRTAFGRRRQRDQLGVVGGVEVCRDGAATGAMPGTLLRSGRDTETVTAS